MTMVSSTSQSALSITAIVLSSSSMRSEARPVDGWAGLRHTLNCDDMHVGTMQNLSNVALNGYVESEFAAA